MKPRARAAGCKQGHEYTIENTRVLANGVRQCRQCDKDRAQEKRDALRTAPKFFRPRKEKCKRGHLMQGDNVKLVKDPWGKEQRQCRACEAFRIEGYRRNLALVEAGLAEPKAPGPRQLDFCKYGHPMEGDNVYIRRDGTGRGCATCRLVNVHRYNAAHPEEVAARKSNSYREIKMIEFEAIKRKILALKTQTFLDRDSLLAKIKTVL